MDKRILTILFLFAVLFGALFLPQKALEETGINRTKEIKKEKAAVPEKIMAIYLTSWSAAEKTKINYAIDLSKRTGVNTVVIDIKDWSGMIPYDTDVPEAAKYGAERVIIKDMPGLVKKLHDNGLYVIARITVFQDPVLASNRNDLAVQSHAGGLWQDYHGLSWINPEKKEAWDYNVSLAKDALVKGFDEVNFDYIRFPSDGDLNDMDLSVPSKEEVIKSFFKYLRESIPDSNISVDVFGLTTVNKDDLGIGQNIEDAYQYFDFVCPMVYPSHYASGFLGFENPADHPFEVVAYSIAKAKIRLGNSKAKLRPWLQDFNLGAEYDTEKVYLQIEALKDILGENYSGYMLWNPENFYNEEAIIKGIN